MRWLTLFALVLIAVPRARAQWQCDPPGNERPDWCDIEDGTSEDVDDDGIPDECDDLPTGCTADWDENGQVNSTDIAAFLTSWLDSVNNNLNADFNEDLTVDSNDISAFLTAWTFDVNNGC